jgi:hypothetical protein
MVFEKSLLRRIFDSNGDETIGDWRKLHNEKFHNLYSSPNIFGVINARRIKWAKHVVRIGDTGFLMGKQQGKRPLGRPRRG